MVYAGDLKSPARKGLWVRVPPAAPQSNFQKIDRPSLLLAWLFRRHRIMIRLRCDFPSLELKTSEAAPFLLYIRISRTTALVLIIFLVAYILQKFITANARQTLVWHLLAHSSHFSTPKLSCLFSSNKVECGQNCKDTSR